MMINDDDGNNEILATMKGSNRDRKRILADIQEKSNSEKVVRCWVLWNTKTIKTL